MYCCVCNAPHDHVTLSISTSVTLWYIRGSWWPNGLGIYLARWRSWVRVPRRNNPRFFLLGYLLCGSQFMLFKFNCNTLGWKTVPFIFINIFSLPLYRAIIAQYHCAHCKLEYLRVLWRYSDATVTGATMHAVAVEYPHSTLKCTPPCSSQSGTVKYETYISDQAESVCVK